MQKTTYNTWVDPITWEGMSGTQSRVHHRFKHCIVHLY